MRKSEPLRFAFALVDGPCAGLRFGGWRLWTHNESTYITAKALRDTWKVSLHGDDYWASAITKENAARADSVLPDGAPRAMWQFDLTPFENRHRLAFAIGVFRHAFRPEDVDRSEVEIRVPDKWDHLALALVRMTEPGVDPDPSWDLIGGPFVLSNGRRVWLTASLESIGPTEPEPVPVATMITPVTPETDGVRSPGWLVKGVHLG